MSDIIEKSLASLPKLLFESLLGGVSGSSSAVSGTRPFPSSRGFHNFVRVVTHAKNRHEEEHYVKQELSLLKQRLVQPDVTLSQMRDHMCRLVYCSLLGYDTSFGDIHAIKLAQQGSLQEKRIGYLACSLFLHKHHDLVVLLINSLQKDLSSSNMLENCMALMLASRVVNSEMIPSLLPTVLDKLKHPRDIVRKKAVVCLTCFHDEAPELMEYTHDRFHAALCDKDPGVMAVSLHVFLHLAKRDPEKYAKYVTGFCHTLSQVINRKLPKDYDYHGIPAPWIQVLLLKILAELRGPDAKSKEMLNSVLKDTLQRAIVKSNAAFAVLYECIVTITRVPVTPDLLQAAVECINGFMHSSSDNLKYLGLKALSRMVCVAPELVHGHQVAVVECLKHPDKVICKQTYNLLYQMANKANVAVICRKLSEYLLQLHDEHVQADIVNKITELITKFSPDRRWFISHMLELLDMTGGKAEQKVVPEILQVLQTDVLVRDDDDDFSRFLFDGFIKYLQRDGSSNRLIQMSAWIMGEHYHGSFDENTAVLSRLLHYFSSPDSDVTSKLYIVSAVKKLLLRNEFSVDMVQAVLPQLKNSTQQSIVKQQVGELDKVAQLTDTDRGRIGTHRATPYQQCDFTLSFLDSFVTASLDRGDMPYIPLSYRNIHQYKNDIHEAGMGYIELLDTSGKPGHGTETNNRMGSSSTSTSHGRTTSSTKSAGGKEEEPILLNLSGVKRVWGHDGVTAESGQGQISDGGIRTQTSLSTMDSESSSSMSYRSVNEELAEALFKGVGEMTVSPSVTSTHTKPFATHEIASSHHTRSKNQTSKSADTSDWSSSVQLKTIPNKGDNWRNIAAQNIPSQDMDTASEIEPCASLESRSETMETDSGVTMASNTFNNVSIAIGDSGADTDNIYTSFDLIGQAAENFNQLQGIIPETPVNIYEQFKFELSKDDILTTRDRTSESNT